MFYGKIEANVDNEDDAHACHRRGPSDLKPRDTEEDEKSADKRPHAILFVMPAVRDMSLLDDQLKIYKSARSFLLKQPQPVIKIVIGITMLDKRDPVVKDHPEYVTEGRRESTVFNNMVDHLVEKGVPHGDIYPLINEKDMPMKYSNRKLMYTHAMALHAVSRLVDMGSQYSHDLVRIQKMKAELAEARHMD